MNYPRIMVKDGTRLLIWDEDNQEYVGIEISGVVTRVVHGVEFISNLSNESLDGSKRPTKH